MAYNLINLINLDNSYKKFFDEPEIKKILDKINTYLNTRDPNKIFPESQNIFKALELTPLNEIKVVILGQDPYHTKGLATGLAFSIPHTKKIPSSLKNIFDNLIKFNHYKVLPKSGSLEHWAQQGCLLLNTALTVEEGKPNSHKKKWENFTDLLIQFISEECDNIIFVLWGNNSLNKLNLIDQNKHKVLITSHPSGLSYKHTLNIYPDFYSTNHFNIINEHLNNKSQQIIW